jgi:hypothetical protein
MVNATPLVLDPTLGTVVASTNTLARRNSPSITKLCLRDDNALLRKDASWT